VVGVGHEPVQVQAVGVELSGGGGDQGPGGRGVFGLVQGGVDRGDPVRVEAVLVLAQVQDEDLVVVVECGHGVPCRGGRFSLRGCSGRWWFVPGGGATRCWSCGAPAFYWRVTYGGQHRASKAAPRPRARRGSGRARSPLFLPGPQDRVAASAGQQVADEPAVVCRRLSSRKWAPWGTRG